MTDFVTPDSGMRPTPPIPSSDAAASSGPTMPPELADLVEDFLGVDALVGDPRPNRERPVASRIELLPSEFAEVVEHGRAWLAVYEPCGTEGCESPTCQLAYAIRRAIQAEEAISRV